MALVLNSDGPAGGLTMSEGSHCGPSLMFKARIAFTSSKKSTILNIARKGKFFSKEVTKSDKKRNNHGRAPSGARRTS